MSGKCPHCLYDVHFTDAEVGSPGMGSGQYGFSQFECTGEIETVNVHFLTCPHCKRVVVRSYVTIKGKTQERFVWPTTTIRLVPLEVPEHIKKDYVEAADVLPISSKASAALSRRCLQTVLTEAGKAKSKDLSKQIDEVLPSLPSHLAGSVDAIRAVGNFAAHPIKSKSSGAIVEVEPGEAEWNLDVLDGLFDFYYVQPVKTKQKKDALNKKLKEAGKKPLK
jgi:hypothetical protein